MHYQLVVIGLHRTENVRFRHFGAADFGARLGVGFLRRFCTILQKLCRCLFCAFLTELVKTMIYHCDAHKVYYHPVEEPRYQTRKLRSCQTSLFPCFVTSYRHVMKSRLLIKSLLRLVIFGMKLVIMC